SPTRSTTLSLHDALPILEAPDVYIYIRDEYPDVRLMLAEEIAKVERAGLAEHARLHLRRGAGAYICGEESAMIESIEGKRGLPRSEEHTSELQSPYDLVC